MASRSVGATLLIAAFSLATAGSAAADEAPAVVVSIKPVHSLVAGVMAGVGEPVLLVQGAGSEHSYSLRPSQARALDQAEVVFWMGETMETFLIKPLQALSGNAKVVALWQSPGLTLLPTREGGMWEEHDHGDEHAEAHDDEHEHAHGETDMHVWLDPSNAKVLAAAIATTTGPMPQPIKPTPRAWTSGWTSLIGCCKASWRPLPSVRTWCFTMPINISSTATG
jgi:zinc transport system substrate-binding protein